MRDPVDIDLDRYLTSLEEAEFERDQEELELFNERLSSVMRILNSDANKTVMSRRLVNLIEHYVEEFHERY